MADKNPTKAEPHDRSLAMQLMHWRILNDAVEENAGDLAHAVAHNRRFAKLLAEILSSVAEQKVLTARLQAVVRERQGKVLEVCDLRSRLAAAAVGRYGPRSEKLREFGLKPRRRPRRSAPRREVRTR